MKYLILVAAVVVLSLSACTEQIMSRSWGGSSEIKLKCGQKLFDLTWKNSDFWYATRPMRADESAETYVFSESSSWGAFEGTVTIRECD